MTSFASLRKVLYDVRVEVTVHSVEFFLKVFTEFSDKNIILKRLLGSNPLSPV